MIKKVRHAMEQAQRGSSGWDRFVDKAFYGVALGGFAWLAFQVVDMRETNAEMRGDIKNLQTQINELQQDSLSRAPSISRITRLEARLDALERNIISRLDRIEKRIQ